MEIIEESKLCFLSDKKEGANEKSNGAQIYAHAFLTNIHKPYAPVIGLPGRGTPGLPGGNKLKLKKSAPQYLGFSGLLGLFLAGGLGIFSGVSGWLPLSLLT